MSFKGVQHTRSGSSGSTRLATYGNTSRNPILSIAFNQDNSCFSIGLESGFRVYSTDPLREVLRREFDEGGIGVVSMLYRTNIMALVGGGRNPRFAPSKVILFDEKMGKTQAELEFRSEVKRVILAKDRYSFCPGGRVVYANLLFRMIIVLKGKIHIYTLDRRPRQLQVIETIDNPGGVCAVAIVEETTVIAYPGLQVGQVCLMSLGTSDSSPSSVVAAHKSPIAALALSKKGGLLATASEKGTLVRVFEVRTGKLKYELRRGADRAEIYDIVFSEDSTKVCASSDKGTVHIFSLDLLPELGNLPAVSESMAMPAANRQSSLAFMKEMLPKYFASQWSFAQCRVSEARSVVCFGADPSTIYGTQCQSSLLLALCSNPVLQCSDIR